MPIKNSTQNIILSKIFYQFFRKLNNFVPSLPKLNNIGKAFSNNTNI